MNLPQTQTISDLNAKAPVLPGQALHEKRTPRRWLTKKSSASNGFTLVELLVVILIIIVLAALALFVLKNTKQKAYQVKALSTMRQVVTGNIAYSTENNGDINVVLDTKPTPDPRIKTRYIVNNYWGRLAPYIFPDVALADNNACKAQLKMSLNSLFSSNDVSTMSNTFQQGSDVYADGSGLPLPLAFSQYIYSWGVYKRTAAYSDPSQTLYMTFGAYRFDETDAATYAPIPPKNTKHTNNIDYLPSKVGIFSFLDGHVEVLSPPIPIRRFTTTP